ncbi:MAG: sucB [Gammaproteobacteria bacterium]|jgi:2-oxoglutarate dehydrogenase E2 component (dihydrolipoamide succinyltransferase)|nr:sucB [Gammaproteobacteria bacterium]
MSEIKVPMLPESVADATVATWHVKPGQAVKRDQNIVDLETDKVMIEIPALYDGVLQSIEKPEGSTVLAGEVLGLFTQGAASAASMPQESVAATAAKAAPASAPVPAAVSSTGASAKSSAQTTSLSPSLRRFAAEHDVDPNTLKGQATQQDIIAPASQPLQAAALREEKRVPMSRLRARIAERLLVAQQTTASLTTFNEINLQAVLNLRSQYKDAFEKKHGVRLGFMSFFTKAAIEALKRFPLVNASIDGTDVIYHGFYDIGMAVSTERGLVVPVLRNAEQLSMAEIEKAVSDFAAKARNNQLTIEEITGGTFTITNGGVFGSLLSTPILNPPQSAILGLHKIEERAVVEKGQVVVRPMMYVALTYDHRIIDGKESVQFLATIKELLEDPARLLLSV